MRSLLATACLTGSAAGERVEVLHFGWVVLLVAVLIVMSVVVLAVQVALTQVMISRHECSVSAAADSFGLRGIAARDVLWSKTVDLPLLLQATEIVLQALRTSFLGHMSQCHGI